MTNHKVLQGQFNVDVQEPFEGYNLPGMSLGDFSSGITHCQSLASSRDLVHPVSVISTSHLERMFCAVLRRLRSSHLSHGQKTTIVQDKLKLTSRANTTPP